MDKRLASTPVKELDTPLKPKTQNFINYNNLDRQSRMLFAHCGLEKFIGIAGNLLRKHIGSVNPHKFNVPFFTESDLTNLNSMIEDLLELIGKWSNKRFGTSASVQDRFFQKAAEGATFPVHLFISRHQEANEFLCRKDKKYERLITKNGKTLSAFSNGIFDGIPPATIKKIKFGRNKLTKTEIRAVGVLYMVGLVWNTIHENAKILPSSNAKAVNFAKSINFALQLFSLIDESDQMVARITGGTLGGKTKRSSKYEKQFKIIWAVVQKNPEAPTVKLVSQSLAHMVKKMYKKPPRRWCSDQVRNIKKRIRGT